MFELALHTGIEHPDLLWILVPSFLSFVAGALLGANADRLRALREPTASDSTN